MAYYASHNLAYDFTLFEEPNAGEPSARLKKKASEDAAAAADDVGEKHIEEKTEKKRTTSKKRVKASRRRSRFGRIAFGVILGVAFMAIIVSIIHGQVLLTELNQEIVDARAELAEQQSIYTQLEMKVDSSVSTTVVEQYARDNLSMSKASNSQKEFVSLSEGDKADVTMSEDKNIFERIGEAFASLWS